ncbi:MAG TPA: M23 family metallopeptidase [Acidimicrobiales bacterium]|nr:M23 family metallopeptidase [Acidimicrobiales bacterium]
MTPTRTTNPTNAGHRSLSASRGRSRLWRGPIALLVLLLVGGLVAPADGAGADSLAAQRQRRAALRAQRAKVAAQLDTLKASDRELEAAVAALGAQVKATQAQAAAARRAVDAARKAVSDAEAQLAQTQAEIAAMSAEVKARAVSSYVRPQGDLLSSLATSSDLNEATRRTAYLTQVAKRGRDVVDRLGAAREDQEIQQEAARKAREAADARKAAADAKAKSAADALFEQARAKAALDGRIREFQGLMAQMAASDAGLSSLIRQREASSSIGSGVVGGVSSKGLIWPTSGRVTSEYGYRWGRLHAGIDIGAPTGTPIRAAQAGEVIFSGTQNGYGNTVVIAHGGGFSTLYGHQSRIAARDGQQVARGDVIGYVGSTGHSTGPHLHFETRVNGSAQNPRKYLP